jgi:succinoglycan biosynthesis transport protein ExoP
MTVHAETDALMALAAQAQGRRRDDGPAAPRALAPAVLAALWRARAAAAAGAAIALVVAAAGLSALPPRYVAQVEILLDPAADAPLSSQSIESQARVLLSRGSLNAVVAGLRLEDELASAPLASGGVVARIAGGLAAGARARLGWTPAAGAALPDAEMRRASAIDALAAMLSVRRAGDSRALVLSARDGSARRAALIANAAADAFLADQARAKRDDAARGAVSLRARMDDLRPRLLAAEAAADALRLRAVTMRPEGATATERLARLAAARDALIAQGAQASDPRLGALDRAIAAQQAEAAAQSRGAASLEEADHAAAALRAVRDEALVALARIEAPIDPHRPDARVIAAASPPQAPSGPAQAPALAIAALLGALVGALGYLAREALLGLPATPAALARICNLPIVAATPRPTARHPDSVLDARLRPGGACAEAGRALRVAALHAAQAEAGRRGQARDPLREGGRRTLRGDGLGLLSLDMAPGGLVIAVAGATEAAGASGIAALLAESLARMGRKVCLVDADLRAPAQAARYGLEAETDLLAVLDGESPLDDALWPTDLAGLTVLPAAPAPSLRGEVLAEAGMDDLMDALRRRFDVVVIDAPTPSGAADGRLLAGLADATVLAVRWGRTGRGSLRAAIAALESAGANAVAIALTDAHGPATPAIATWSAGKYARFAEGFAD